MKTKLLRKCLRQIATVPPIGDIEEDADRMHDVDVRGHPSYDDDADVVGDGCGPYCVS